MTLHELSEKQVRQIIQEEIEDVLGELYVVIPTGEVKRRKKKEVTYKLDPVKAEQLEFYAHILDKDEGKVIERALDLLYEKKRI